MLWKLKNVKQFNTFLPSDDPFDRYRSHIVQTKLAYTFLLFELNINLHHTANLCQVGTCVANLWGSWNQRGKHEVNVMRPEMSKWQKHNIAVVCQVHQNILESFIVLALNTNLYQHKSLWRPTHSNFPWTITESRRPGPLTCKNGRVAMDLISWEAARSLVPEDPWPCHLWIVFLRYCVLRICIAHYWVNHKCFWGKENSRSWRCSFSWHPFTFLSL